MASRPVVDSVAAYLAAGFAAAPILGPNSADEARPAGRAPWVALEFPVAERAQASIGSPGLNVIRETGAIRLVVHVQTGGGLAQGYQHAAALTTLIRGRRIPVLWGTLPWGEYPWDGGDLVVETRVPSPPALRPALGAGGYYSLSISTPYRLDLFG